MIIAFVTTQSISGSTVVGRVIPLAKELHKQGHTVHILIHGKLPKEKSELLFHAAGEDPFIIENQEKKRLSGIALAAQLLKNIYAVLRTLIQVQPDCVVIVKPLPENTIACMVAKFFITPKSVVLDVDDFELTANVLSSLWQRATIHFSERLAAHMATHIVVATPFLQDHMSALVRNKKPITSIPTGTSLASSPSSDKATPRLVYVGSISQASGHRVDMLPEIMASLIASYPNLELLMIGSGHDTNQIQEAFKKHHVDTHVEWLGRFSSETLHTMIGSHDILIDPVDTSITNRAKSSFRVALALVFGLPVVTSSIGIRSILLPASLHARLFATAGDTASYTEMIKKLLAQPLTQEEKTALQKAAQEYTWEKLAATYNTVL